MTIFDALRYPISDPPTAEEFRQLPPKLLASWTIKNNFNISEDPSDLEEYYAHFPGQSQFSRESDLFELDDLRKMIKEYDDDL